jgi:ubiquitin-like protein Pup
MPTHDSGQTRPQRQHVDAEDAETSTTADAEIAERHEKLSEDVDAILDEIDDVLETNAEEFVRSFVQKGGE